MTSHPSIPSERILFCPRDTTKRANWVCLGEGDRNGRPLTDHEWREIKVTSRRLKASKTRKARS